MEKAASIHRKRKADIQSSTCKETKKDDFHIPKAHLVNFDLTEAFVCANIHFEKLDNQKLWKFFRLSEANGGVIPSSAQLRLEYLPKVSEYHKQERMELVTIFLHFLWIGPLQAVAVTALLWQEIGPSCLAGMAILVFLMPLQTFFGRLFSKLRKEISKVKKSSYLRGMNMASFFVASKIILFITFTTFVLLGNPISASKVFVTVSLYSAVRLTVTLFFPSAIEKASETMISIRRIKNFLILDEIVKPSVELRKEEKKDVLIHMKDVICYWDKNLDAPTLQNVSFTVHPGQLLAVIGPVGAGKSSLLSAILGELPQDRGDVKVKGKLGFAAQQPWVFSGTLRSNILFGMEYNPQKYEQVIGACALNKDIDILPDGDMTVIGDRGATLSGGQKARVNLARAVYQDTDIYLLDDPLSAVDAEVGRHLFEKCICGILRNKPRILVTHQLQYLQATDQILVLKEGHMIAKGTYGELQRSGVDFTSLLKKDEDEEDEDEQAPTEQNGSRSARCRTISQNSAWSQTSSSQSTKDGTADLPPAEAVTTVLSEESRSEGSIGVRLYWKYFIAGANCAVLVLLFLLSLLAQTAYILQDWWLSYWASEQEKLNITQDAHNHNETQQLDLSFYLGVYAGLTVVTVIFGFIRSLLLFKVLVNSAQTLHNQMFQSILRTPVRFFDVNPIGRILNRFSKDIGQLDSLLALTFADFIQISLQIVGVIAVAVSVIPWIIIPLIPLLIIFIILRRYFLQTSRDVKRLESTTRSPVFSHLSSSLQGLWTIRAFKAEQRFQSEFDDHQDLHSESWFLFLTTSRWFSVRLDGLCTIFVPTVAFGSLLLANELEAGNVGLALSYAITLVGMFQWGVRQSAEVENQMTSVERVLDYTELENEAPWVTECRPPPDWPRHGVIVFEGVNFAYSRDGPHVLKNINAVFRSKEKVGIVGRTGAGKSSLISALFRLAEPDGNIRIDGVLTSELGLHDLRTKMSIIPQVQLKGVVEELPSKMETQLAESGSNFSVGQRQLVCLARAILRKTRILIIDEATANVDPRTDVLIQKTIREKFEQCTVLTIAHRLNTIIDSDRILVLDAGKIHEYDEPYVLLQNNDSIFYKMVQQTGKAEAAALLETAKQCGGERNLVEGVHSTVAKPVLPPLKCRCAATGGCQSSFAPASAPPSSPELLPAQPSTSTGVRSSSLVQHTSPPAGARPVALQPPIRSLLPLQSPSIQAAPAGSSPAPQLPGLLLSLQPPPEPQASSRYTRVSFRRSRSSCSLLLILYWPSTPASTSSKPAFPPASTTATTTVDPNLAPIFSLASASVSGPHLGPATRRYTISSAVHRQIIEGKDVNLISVLIATAELIDHQVVCCGDFSVALKSSDPRLLENLTLGEFVLAFSIFRDVLCTAYRHGHEELALYLTYVVELSVRYGCTMFLEYLATKNPSLLADLLFTDSSRTVVTRHWFSSCLATLISRPGLPARFYTPHSFRIGDATSAARAGINQPLIKTGALDLICRSPTFDPPLLTSQQLICQGSL
ncbi:Multidrug resistance-associated protein 4 [Acipenser ruthenus]|uniref:Multidrug resistance-associated protein 4 n=1 Tax=Acipenser ruthenus TaxID=7906 RepID=A0A444UPN2_ACIRT|nr:Multidrug resistance-associated protein 4 [Acipenser ruthenus]